MGEIGVSAPDRRSRRRLLLAPRAGQGATSAARPDDDTEERTGSPAAGRPTPQPYAPELALLGSNVLSRQEEHERWMQYARLKEESNRAKDRVDLAKTTVRAVVVGLAATPPTAGAYGFYRGGLGLAENVLIVATMLVLATVAICALAFAMLRDHGRVGRSGASRGRPPEQ